MRAHACDQVGLVAGVDVSIAVLACEPLAVLARVIEVLSDQDDLRAQVAHGFDLHRVGVLRGTDDGAHSEQSRSKRDRLAVVAGRSGDHTARARLCIQLRHEVDPAADLERAGGEEVLMLHPDLGPDQPVDGWVVAQRARIKVRPDAASCRQDVSERWRVHIAQD